MKIFSYLYRKVLRWSEHPSANYILAGVSFTEASCFPIPPDVLLIPMGLSAPNRAWFFATLTTLFSVLGGLFGYFLGAFFMHLLLPVIEQWGYHPEYILVQSWFAKYGFIALLVAGFTPVPYKIFTLTAGAAGLPLMPFILGSLLGRGARFYLVSSLIYFGGERMRDHLAAKIDAIGWITLLLIIIVACGYFIFVRG